MMMYWWHVTHGHCRGPSLSCSVSWPWRPVLTSWGVVRRARGRRKQQPTRPYQRQQQQQQQWPQQQQQQQQQNRHTHHNIKLGGMEQWGKQQWRGLSGSPPGRGHLYLGVVASWSSWGVGPVPCPPLGAAPCPRCPLSPWLSSSQWLWPQCSGSSAQAWDPGQWSRRRRRSSWWEERGLVILAPLQCNSPPLQLILIAPLTQSSLMTTPITRKHQQPSSNSCPNLLPQSPQVQRHTSL